MTYRSDKSEGPTAGTETVDPLESSSPAGYDVRTVQELLGHRDVRYVSSSPIDALLSA